MSGLLALYLEDYDLASLRFAELLERTRKSGDKTKIGFLLMGTAIVSSRKDQLQQAAKLYGAAQAAVTAFDTRTPAKDGEEFERHILAARDQLGQAAFGALQDEGRAMSTEQAIEYARQALRYAII